MQAIDSLIACHEDEPFRKWFGYCNGVKRALDKCLRAEKEVRRKNNLMVALGNEDNM